jgi:hypothetical protein
MFQFKWSRYNLCFFLTKTAHCPCIKKEEAHSSGTHCQPRHGKAAETKTKSKLHRTGIQGRVPQAKAEPKQNGKNRNQQASQGAEASERRLKPLEIRKRKP